MEVLGLIHTVSSGIYVYAYLGKVYVMEKVFENNVNEKPRDMEHEHNRRRTTDGESFV